METAVGACNSVRYSVDVRYWECPLIESPLYIELNTTVKCGGKSILNIYIKFTELASYFK